MDGKDFWEVSKINNYSDGGDSLAVPFFSLLPLLLTLAVGESRKEKTDEVPVDLFFGLTFAFVFSKGCSHISSNH
jgi:hypothetical protein